MIKYTKNLHTHGTMCDGKNDYEDTVKVAIEKGFTSIGFSSHSDMPYSPGKNLKVHMIPTYQALIGSLKEKYKGIIDIYCGIEFDIFSPDPLVGYDYVLGAVHYLETDSGYVGFDRIADTVKKVIDEHFEGDGMKYAKKYYETVARLPEYGKIDVVAHFDLICKHREKENFFDTESKKYRSWALEAMEHLNKTVGVFEVNTGAVARGYRTTPYPDTFLLKAMKEQGAKMTVSSDCHDNTMLDYLFDESLELLRSVGFSEVYTLGDNGFVGHKI